MEPVGIALGLVGLFNSCLHGYRAVAEALQFGNNAVGYDLKMRIERERFMIWGRNWRLLDPKSGEEKNEEPGDLDEILQVDGFRRLVLEVLGAISDSLTDFNDMSVKYKMEKKSPGSAIEVAVEIRNEGKDKDDVAGDELRTARSDAKKRGITIGKNISLPKKILFVVKDKAKMESLLKDLTHWNDSLDKLLPKQERAFLSRGLASGVLEATGNTSTELEMIWKAPDLKDLLNSSEDTLVQVDQSSNLALSAFVKQVCLSLGEAPDEQSKTLDMEIDSSKLKLLEEPVTTSMDHDTHFWPRTLAEYSESEANNNQETVLIEWRPAKVESHSSKMTLEELIVRCNHITKLLHQTSIHDVKNDYKILNCIGFVRAEGRLDGEAIKLIGFIYRLPSWAMEGSLPVTLEKLLSESYHSEDATAPSLTTRYKLACQLSLGIYQLQCSEWLHRKLSNNNIIFFINARTGTLDLTQPFLAGFSHSRPDDQHIYGPSELVKMGERQNAYIHPTHFKGKGRRFKRSDDIYAFGVLLFELAFWEPIQIFNLKEFKRHDIINLSSQLLSITTKELAAEMGDRYKEVVLNCLTGLGQKKPEEEWTEPYDGKTQKGDREIGLESMFFWNVVMELHKFKA